MRDLYLGSDGEIYQQSWDDGSSTTRVTLPKEVTQGAMKFLSLALTLWFDCFEELEKEFHIDLCRTLRAVPIPAAPPPPLPQSYSNGRSSWKKNDGVWRTDQEFQ